MTDRAADETIRRRLRDDGLDHGGLRRLERRLLLRRGLTLGSAALLAGCDITDQAPVNRALRAVSRLNDRVQAALFRPDHLSPGFTRTGARVGRLYQFNAAFPADQTPTIDAASWRLEVGGRVAERRSWTIAELRALPQISWTAEHVCVEGWSFIGNWGGVKLRDFLERVGADTRARFVGLRCHDPVNYTGSIDMASALHPQTILCLTQAGEPLTAPYGAPMRLRMTTKLGFKQPKWITAIEVSDTMPPDYWAERGFNWYSGL